MRIVKLRKAALHVRIDGPEDGNPLVFANSLGTDLRVWDKIVPLLPTGLRIIRFDKRGHGLSSCPAGPYGIDDLVDDTEELLDHLGIRGATFVGLSIGGQIGQGLALRRPDIITSLVLSNTAAKLGDAQMWADRIAAIKAGGIAALSDAILERWFGPVFRRGDELEAWRNMLERTPAAGYLGCCHAVANADMTGLVPALRLPALAIGGSEDGASPPDLVRATAALIPGCRYEEIADAGHLPCVEAPEAYAELLSAFLKGAGHV
ncbi:3-oxoadipate enol-lactonase [Oricola sp.]|uniref:3-oxoadipate enol-lactonase n=1 Tax=Oricola sp. TaxID=1979950 RepID=UPI003BAC1532